MKMIDDFVFNPKEVRRRLGLNQQEFWSRIGVTQSGGSRYESGRRMPKPVQELLRVIHVEGIDLSKINRVDLDVVGILKAQDPAAYQRLCEESRRAVSKRVAPTQMAAKSVDDRHSNSAKDLCAPVAADLPPNNY